MSLDSNKEFKPIETEQKFKEEIFKFLKEFIHEDFLSPFVASIKEQKKRREICNSCEHRKPLKDKCGLCGCKLDSKIISCFDRCPDSRWDCDFDGFAITCYNPIMESIEEKKED